MIYENDHVMNLTGSLGLELNRPANDDVRVRVIRGDAWSRPRGIEPQTDALTLARRSPRRCAGTWSLGGEQSCRRQELLYVCCCDLLSSALVVAEVSGVAAVLRRETVCGVVVGGPLWSCGAG
jgi:hypothetical protein